MSLIDVKWEIWDDQALTASEESRTNGNIVDMETGGATDAQLGFLWLNILVGTAAGGMASGGYFEVLTSDTATFDAGSGAEQCIAAIGSAAHPLFAAHLAAGKKFGVCVPMRALHKYVEVAWVAVTEAASALKVDAWFGLEPESDLKTQKEPS